MSFGFGAGDFLAVTELAIRIRKRFSDGPAKLQEISHEVKGLLIVLLDVEVLRGTMKSSHPSKRDDLKTIVEGSYRVLLDLESFRISMFSPSTILMKTADNYSQNMML